MDVNVVKLKSIYIEGYKSISPGGQSIDFGDITILLGANGSGKSNLISFFKMLISIAEQRFQLFVEKQGGADAVLYYGSKRTDNIKFDVQFKIGEENNATTSLYSARLTSAAPDRLVFLSEMVKTPGRSVDKTEHPFTTIAGAGPESDIISRDLPKFSTVNNGMKGIRTYQFHDTSDTSSIKKQAYSGDCKYLRSDAGNLAAFLYELAHNEKKYYDRIVRHIKKVMPQFKDFYLTLIGKNDLNLMLNWYDSYGETLFGPHQISDGSLRFMALAALLLQPPSMIPNIIVIDEPELGLHPAAIAELAGMIKTASKHSQIIVATQSTRLVDEFSIDNVMVVERDETNHETVFKRLAEKQFTQWLERYSVSELWEKNVLGGQP